MRLTAEIASRKGNEDPSRVRRRVRRVGLFLSEFSTTSRANAGDGNPAGLPSLSYVHKASDRVRFGLNIFAIAGSGLNPKNDWAGRFEVTDLSLTELSISPAIAIRVTDWLSVGVGVNYQWDEDWLLQTGLMYDTPGLKNRTRSTALPVDRQICFAFGFHHDLSEALTLSFKQLPWSGKLIL